MRWTRTRFVEPLKAQLTQGVSPSRLAAALALGAVLGVLPVLGVTTVLGALLAALLKLNQPALQLANYAVYPLQLLLFVPFLQAGADLFGGPPVVLSLAQVQAEFARDLVGALAGSLGAVARAVAVWALVALPAYAMLFGLLRALLRRLPLPTGPGARS